MWLWCMWVVGGFVVVGVCSGELKIKKKKKKSELL